MTWYCCSCKSWMDGRKSWGNRSLFGGGWFVFNTVLNLSIVVTALWQKPCSQGVWRKLRSLILINAPSIISPSKLAFSHAPLWHCLFMPHWRSVTSPIHCSSVWIDADSMSAAVVSLHLWTMKSVSLLKIVQDLFFFSPLPPSDVNLVIYLVFFPSCVSLLCCSIYLLFSCSKQVSGLFCCVMWPGVKIRKVSLLSKACNFYFYPQLLELIAKSQLTSLSGIAQKNYMNILEKVVQKGKKWKHWGGGGVWFNLMYSAWTTSSRIGNAGWGKWGHHFCFL